MRTLKGWKGLLAYLERSPFLEYVYGFRHLVKQGAYCGEHCHSTIEIVYHAVGAGRVALPMNRSLAFPERSVIIHAPRELHDQIMDNAGEDTCVHVALPRGVRLDGVRAICLEKIEGLEVLQDIEFLSRGYFHPERSERVILHLRATALLMSLLREASRTPSAGEYLQTDEARVQRAEQYMRERYPSIDSIRSVARDTGIGYDYLRHCFKTLRGKSLIRYLSEIRVERAKSLLIHSQLSIKEISTACGFRDEYYFSGVFKDFIGTSPLHYRRRNLFSATGPAAAPEWRRRSFEDFKIQTKTAEELESKGKRRGNRKAGGGAKAGSTR